MVCINLTIMDICTLFRKSYSAVIFDLGDVLFTWSLPTQESLLPAKVLRRILHSVHWFEYEKGNLDEDQVYSLVAQEYNLSLTDVKCTFQVARETLKKNTVMLNIIRELKEAGLVIYAMSNISTPDWVVLSRKATPEEWSLFDHIFTSYVAWLVRVGSLFFD